MKITIWINPVPNHPSHVKMRVDSKEQSLDTPRIVNLGREIYASLQEICDDCNGAEIKRIAGSKRAKAAMERQESSKGE